MISKLAEYCDGDTLLTLQFMVSFAESVTLKLLRYTWLVTLDVNSAVDVYVKDGSYNNKEQQIDMITTIYLVGSGDVGPD